MKGATRGTVQQPGRDIDFNPRTHEGCDFGKGMTFPKLCHFNPRTHEGCDLNDVEKYINLLNISIHAPMKGATSPGLWISLTCLHFNPRTHEGCDLLSKKRKYLS